MFRTMTAAILGATLLAACAGPDPSGATQLQLSAAHKAGQFGIDVDPRSLSPATSARINAINIGKDSDARIRSKIRAALR